MSGKKKLEKRSTILRLGIPERIALNGIQPRKGSRLTLQVVDEIKKKAIITLEEQKRIKYKEEVIPGTMSMNVVWDLKKEKPLDIVLTPFEVDLLKKTINFLDSQEELLEEWRSLADKIVKL